MAIAKKHTPLGTIRINSKNLKAYELTSKGWVQARQAQKDFTDLLNVVKLYKSEGRFKELIDVNNPKFLKGQLSPQGIAFGARINILPNGEKLEKAFSLFSPNLTIHDQTSHDHWDVMYQNTGGTWSYVYTLNKRKNHMASKYRKVEVFEKNYKKLMSNIRRSLGDENDYMAVPMHTLLNTHMRVGNETYFKRDGHKGLTTLMKNNILVKSPLVMFNYVGKDGVPINISKKFLNTYISRLKNILDSRKNKEFVFEKNGRILHEHDFKEAFRKYCGHEFYPHIVRSHYATMKVKNFLKTEKKITKEKADKLFIKIAHELGHKKFNKKNHDWQDNYTVTIHSYVQPELIERLQKRISNKK